MKLKCSKSEQHKTFFMTLLAKHTMLVSETGNHVKQIGDAHDFKNDVVPYDPIVCAVCLAPATIVEESTDPEICALPDLKDVKFGAVGGDINFTEPD
jgi:hypothetical protein